MHSITPLLAAFHPFHPGILIPIISLCIPILVMWMYYHSTNQRRRLWHETARLALEKGQPLPPPEEPAARSSVSAPLQDLRAGLILVAIGTAIYLGKANLPTDKGKMALMGALIPAFIGLAFLLNAAITAFASRRASRQSPPQS